MIGSCPSIGDLWAFDSNVGLEALVHDLKQSIRDKIWAKVGHTHNAHGATDGIDPTVAEKYIKKLEASSRAAEAGMARSVLCRAIWGRYRKWEAGLATSALCPRCMLAQDTDVHRYWACPANAKSEHKDIIETQYMCRTAVQEAPSLPCFWLRGLVPANKMPKASEPVAVTEAFGDMNCTGAQKSGPGLYFGDGSGGKHSSDRRLRRCGWSVCHVAPGGLLEVADLLGGVYGTLESHLQTVPRAELWAAIVAINISTGNIEFVTDHLKIYQRWAAKKVFVPGSRNQDLWHQFWQAIDEHDGDVKIRCTKSHTSGDDVLAGITNVQDHTGNEAADALAGIGAEMHCLSTEHVSEVQKIDEQALKVLKRLVAINIEAVNAAKALGPDLSPPKQPKGERLGRCPLGVLVQRSTHKLQSSRSGRWLCTKCGAGRNWIKLACWLRREPKCQGRPQAEHQLSKVGPIHMARGKRHQVGSTYLHESHCLAWFRGVFFCMRCGGWCTQKPVLLAKPCTGNPNSAGKAVLRRLEKFLPPVGNSWPKGH